MKIYRNKIVFLMGLLLLGHPTRSLRLTNMTAPSLQDPRKEMQLYCKFDMGGEDLYAVKWYKDDHEFFRYAPQGSNNYVKYPVPGVNVDSSRSQCTRETCDLMLIDLQRPYSSGAYRCEVSSEAPAFRLASQTYNITVGVVPKQPPAIDGLQDSYVAGDLIQASCSSGFGDPQPRITWYINKALVSPKHVRELQSHFQPVNERVNLKNTVVQLRYPLDKKMPGKEPSSSLEVKCVSSTDGLSSNIAPPLSATRNIMVMDGNQLTVKNQKLHWLDSSARINFPPYSIAFFLLILILWMC